LNAVSTMSHLLYASKPCSHRHERAKWRLASETDELGLLGLRLGSLAIRNFGGKIAKPKRHIIVCLMQGIVNSILFFSRFAHECAI
jgi:hypothetical protein